MIFTKLFLLMLALACTTTNCKPAQRTTQGPNARPPRSKPNPNFRAMAKQIRDLKDLLQDFA